MIVGSLTVVLVVLLAAWGYRELGGTGLNRLMGGITPAQTQPAGDTQPSPAATRSADRPTATSQATSNPGRTYLSVSPPKPASQPADAVSSPLGDLRQPTILVEKSKKLLTVFDDGRVVKCYPAAVGGNVGDKEREGDKRTPEGEFYVCIKKPNTKYVRALGLSYPDIEDAQRGLRQGLIGQGDYDRIAWAIRNRRQPPWETKLGGAILIHGDRRGGRDTQGCIALEDKDILELYPKIPLGTKVIIRP